MFHLELPYVRIPLNLSNASTFPEKMEMIINHLKIDEIFCQVSNKEDLMLPYSPEEKMLYVDEICIPPADPFTTGSTITEILQILGHELKKYVRDNDTNGYETILHCLTDLIKRCNAYQKENDEYRVVGFNHHIHFKVLINSEWHNRRHEFLKLSPKALWDLKEQLKARKDFYDDMLEILKEEYNWHIKIPAPELKPYTWDSPNDELEISELVYLLCKKTELIKFNSEAGGSFPKFRREFFGLFGLSDKNYDKKIYQIFHRKNGVHFTESLAATMTKIAPGSSNAE